MVAELQITSFQTSPSQKSTKNWDKQLGSNEDFINKAVDKEQMKWIIEFSGISFY